MENDFIITKVEWHTQRIRNYEFDKEIVYLAYKNLIDYLQVNKLTTHIILASNDNANDETAIRRSDLTEEGYSFVKKVYNRWLDKVFDKKIAANDFKMLDAALKKLRQSGN
jgi:hypothetical protein